MIGSISKTVLMSALLISLIGTFSLSSYAQQRETLRVGKKGEIHLNSPVRAGGALLKPGMYRVQHVVEGEDHVVIFREVSMGAGYRMGSTWEGKEVARVKCKIEPADKQVSKTKIYLRTNAAGEKEIAEVQVAGESVKHLL
jgi:hypothetical protein